MPGSKTRISDWLLYLLHPELFARAQGKGVADSLAEAQDHDAAETLSVDASMVSVLAGGVYTTSAAMHPGAARLELQDLQQDGLLCCPENHWCEKGCIPKKSLCNECLIPICREGCRSLLASEICLLALVNGGTFYLRSKSHLYGEDLRDASS